MLQTLEEILESCTVKLKSLSSSGWGTGFFIAPNLILTCAHVVEKEISPYIEVYCKNQGKVETAFIEKLYSKPFDIALLRLSSPFNTFPCVYLDTDVRASDIFYTFGYPDDFQTGAPVTFECEGITGDNPPFIKFKYGNARPGLSGSPLLNKRTGKVCGVVNFTRGRATDLGGGGILAETIFAKLPNLKAQQQEFHKNDKTWINTLKSIFNAKVERYVDDFIQGWTNHARTFAKEFSDSRLAVSGDKTIKWQFSVIAGNTISSEFRREIEVAFKEFPDKINFAVSLLEIKSFLSKINNFKMELHSQELLAVEEYVLMKFLSPRIIPKFKFENWLWFRGFLAGASIGAATGVSIAGVGALFGASIGGAIGGMSSDKIQIHQMSKEASAKIIECVEESTKELIARKKEIIDFILSLLVNEPEFPLKSLENWLKEDVEQSGLN
ncbi:hypothetical protein TUMEXPCC7403_16120 [Tumidithrix helvetica PCC 7403]|uniref:S1 family peptidase n=1 Tax=Tumidithrix helvetica TaxID=3457545 RepID=UPI003C9E7DAA